MRVKKGSELSLVLLVIALSPLCGGLRAVLTWPPREALISEQSRRVLHFQETLKAALQSWEGIGGLSAEDNDC